MFKRSIIGVLLCLGLVSAEAQVTSVTATVVDSDGQTWNNGSWSAALYSPNGNPFYNGAAVPTASFGGTLSTTGVLNDTTDFYNTSTITPSGALYMMTVCSQTSAPCSSFSIPVTSSGQFSTIVNASITAPRFNSGPTAFGYLDAEVIPVAGIGSSYFNVTAGVQHFWNGSAWVAGSASIASLGLVAGVAGPNYFFGDSTVAPIGSGDSGTSLQMANRLSNDMLGQKFPFAVSGTTIALISAAVYADFPVNFNTTSNIPKVYIEAGINDANTQTATTGILNNYALAYNAMISWMEIPVLNRVYATTATATGTWVSSNFTNLHPSNTTFGGFRQSTTNGSTLIFSVPAGGSRIGINYAGVISSGGTFTFTIDGVLQTSVCSGSTTFINTGCNGSTTNGNNILREDFPVTPGVTHTAVVTVTSATSGSNTVFIPAVDVIPATPKVGQPTIMASGVIEQNGNANAANTLAFDQAQAAVITSLSSWANVYRVDVRGGTPGVNSTTDMAVNTTVCPGGVSPLHPNSCGYQHWVQTVENTATANNLNIFFPGLGVNPSFINTSLQVQGAVTAGVSLPGIGDALGSFQVATQSANGTLNLANPNVFNNAVPTASIFGQMNCFLSAASNTACDGLTFDAVRAQLAVGFMSQYEMGFAHCPPGVTGGPTNCTWDLFTDPTTGIVTTPVGFNGRARGVATLVAGTVTVSTASAATPSATTTYILNNCGTNSSVSIGTLSVGTVTAGTSFVINSSSTADVSTVCWQIM